MDPPPILGAIFQQAGTVITYSGSAIGSLATKLFIKKEIREETPNPATLRNRRSTLMRSFSIGEMHSNVKRYAPEPDQVPFKLALTVFESTQERLHEALSEESLLAARQALVHAYDHLKAEYRKLDLETKIQNEQRPLVDINATRLKALKLRAFLGDTPQMARLEAVIDDDPALADCLISAHLTICKHKY